MPEKESCAFRVRWDPLPHNSFWHKPTFPLMVVISQCWVCVWVVSHGGRSRSCCWRPFTLPGWWTRLRHCLHTIGKWYLSFVSSEELRWEMGITQKCNLLWGDVEVLIKGCGLKQQKHSSLRTSDTSKSSAVESKSTAHVHTWCHVLASATHRGIVFPSLGLCHNIFQFW